MNAPMALAISKLTYPETEKPDYIKNAKIEFAKPYVHLCIVGYAGIDWRCVDHQPITNLDACQASLN